MPSDNSTAADFTRRLVLGTAVCGLRQTRVLVAVSGGADSVALCRGLHAISAEQQLDLTLAHLNHQLRGEQSDADAVWVTQLANTLGLPLQMKTLDVVGRVSLTGETLEEAARNLRYATLIDIARDCGCSAVAVGHTADDLVETVLHHIVRGTGVAGLRGMPRTRLLADGLQLVRPLLDVSRSEIEDWLAAQQQEFRTDATNAEPAYTRNRIRHELLPLLERDFNPQVRRALLNLASQAAEVTDWLREQAERLLPEVLLDRAPSTLRMQCDRLRVEPACLIRETLLVAWKANDWPQQRMGFKEWSQLADLVRSQGATTLPGGISAVRRGSLLVLQRPE